ncbi:MAG: molybdate ABC transporter substrate-binding protein [Rhodobacteraceae bacterium]|nr:molybdate ABC transporter substrate-binding protein [Paracoccaceae bacterium]
MTFARLIAFALAFWAATLPRIAAAESPVVAAAASVQFALVEIAQAFEAETGETVRLTFGASGNLARQIRQGAPYDLFLSADESFVLTLAEEGRLRDQGVLYAQGRIGALVPRGSDLKPDGTLEDLRAALQDGRLGRFAIANPEHAPYGQRAREALIHAGLWEAIEPHLVIGENIAQAAQFAVSGNADGGIVSYSLAVAPDVAARSEFALIPADWHEPLGQRMALTKRAGPVAEAFYAYLQSPAARAIFDDYGLALSHGEG